MCYHLDKYVWLIFLSGSAFTLIGYFSVCDVLINRFLHNEKSGKAGKVYDWKGEYFLTTVPFILFIKKMAGDHEVKWVIESLFKIEYEPERIVLEIFPDYYYPGNGNHTFYWVYPVPGRDTRCFYHLYPIEKAIEASDGEETLEP